MWKRIASLICLLIICVLMLITPSISCGGLQRNPFNETTNSPQNTYKVELKEQGDLSTLPTGRHEVRFSVFKEEVLTVQDRLLYSGGIYDDRFLNLFPEHAWVSDSVLRFGRKDIIPAVQHDEVSISNETHRGLSYLLVNAGKYEMFLLLDLQPNSTIRLSAQPQTDQKSDLSEVSCKGEFDNNKVIPEKVGSFRVYEKYKGPAHYFIIINDAGVIIKSQEFEPVVTN